MICKHPFVPKIIFLAAAFILYVMILTTHGQLHVWSCFISIVLCFLFALAHIRAGNRFIIAALGFTVCADFFLVVCSPIQQLYGMICFLCAQSLYAFWLHRTYRGKWAVYLRFGLTAIAAAVTFLVLGKKTDPLAVISVCYYANLILNILLSCLHFTRIPMAAVGFILFFLCDTVVGLNAAGAGYLPISENSALHQILNPGFNLAWLFYLPSQVLLALSSANPRKE